MFSSSGREGGVWHIHAHRPLIWFISDKGDNHDTHWSLEFSSNDLMIWKDGKGEEMKVVTLKLIK